MAGAKANCERLRKATPHNLDSEDCHDNKFCINFPCVRRDFHSLLRCDLGILVRGTVAGNECPTLVKVLPDVDVPLTEIARAKRFAGGSLANRTLDPVKFALKFGDHQLEPLRSAVSIIAHSAHKLSPGAPAIVSLGAQPTSRLGL
jgi:hypothetical protein